MQRAFLCLVFVFWSVVPAGADASPDGTPISNEDVVALVKAGVPETVIVSKVQTSPADFDLSTEGILELHRAGVSGAILNAMMAAASEGQDKIAVADEPGTESNGGVEIRTAEEAGCVRNFRAEGSLFKGRTFTTSVTFGHRSFKVVMRRMAKEMARLGYQAVDSDFETGLITAHTIVSYGKGKTVPLNISVEETGSGEVVADFVFTLSGGLVAKQEDARREFCKITTAGLKDLAE